MSMDHILLTNAFVYKKKSQSPVPAGFHFDKQLGAWVSDADNFPMVLDPFHKGTSTKKCDIETGEDQKGQ